MNRRLVLATCLVGLLVGIAGCSMIFGGISDETLDEEADYSDLIDRDADVVIDVEDGDYRAVYNLSETEELSLYSSRLYRDEAIDIEAVRYWYPNGTEVTGSDLAIDQGRTSTEVRVPDGNGTLAFTGSAGSRSFQLRAFVEGSYEVTLPEGYRTTNYVVGSLLFGNVNPSGYEREMVGDRERLTWEDNDSTIDIRFFLPRDLWLFAGLIGLVGILGGGGILYYYRQVKRLKEKREEMGLDVDTDDDSKKRPPPGMG